MQKPFLCGLSDSTPSIWYKPLWQEQKVFLILDPQLPVPCRHAQFCCNMLLFVMCICCLWLFITQVTLATIGTYVQVHKDDPDNRLTAERAFVTLSLFNILRFPVYMLPHIISSLVEVRSVCRVRMAIVGIQNQVEIKEDLTIVQLNFSYHRLK